MGFLDFIFPKYCVNCRKTGDYICPGCFPFISFDFSMICLVCNRPSVDGLTHPGCRGKHTIDGAFCAVAYKGIVKKLIYNFKYKPYLSDLKKTLISLFYESLIQNELFMRTIGKLNNSPAVFIPIPLHEKKLKKRGYNHSELLAQGLSLILNFKTINALQRTKETKTQHGLKLKDRKENLKNAFSINPKYKIINADIFLVDDILTSGLTLLEGAKILKKNGAKKVWGLALARD